LAAKSAWICAAHDEWPLLLQRLMGSDLVVEGQEALHLLAELRRL